MCRYDDLHPKRHQPLFRQAHLGPVRQVVLARCVLRPGVRPFRPLAEQLAIDVGAVAAAEIAHADIWGVDLDDAMVSGDGPVPLLRELRVAALAAPEEQDGVLPADDGFTPALTTGELDRYL